MYRQMHSLSADNGYIGRYIVQSADDRMSANYLQYRIGRISLSANFPKLDIVCTLAFIVFLLSKPKTKKPLPIYVFNVHHINDTYHGADFSCIYVFGVQVDILKQQEVSSL